MSIYLLFSYINFYHTSKARSLAPYNLQTYCQWPKTFRLSWSAKVRQKSSQTVRHMSVWYTEFWVVSHCSVYRVTRGFLSQSDCDSKGTILCIKVLYLSLFRVRMCKTGMRVDKKVNKSGTIAPTHQSMYGIICDWPRHLLVYKYLVITLAIIASQANRISSASAASGLL